MEILWLYIHNITKMTALSAAGRSVAQSWQAPHRSLDDHAATKEMANSPHRLRRRPGGALPAQYLVAGRATQRSTADRRTAWSCTNLCHRCWVMLIGKIRSMSSGVFSRLDTPEELAEVPQGFDGLIWTDRINLIGPLAAARQSADQ